MKEITNPLHFIKIKNFCSVKDTVQCMKGYDIGVEKIFIKITSDKGLLSKKHTKQLLKSK